MSTVQKSGFTSCQCVLMCRGLLNFKSNVDQQIPKTLKLKE